MFRNYFNLVFALLFAVSAVAQNNVTIDCVNGVFDNSDCIDCPASLIQYHCDGLMISVNSGKSKCYQRPISAKEKSNGKFYIQGHDGGGLYVDPTVDTLLFDGVSVTDAAGLWAALTGCSPQGGGGTGTETQTNIVEVSPGLWEYTNESGLSVEFPGGWTTVDTLTNAIVFTYPDLSTFQVPLYEFSCRDVQNCFSVDSLQVGEEMIYTIYIDGNTLIEIPVPDPTNLVINPATTPAGTTHTILLNGQSVGSIFVPASMVDISTAEDLNNAPVTNTIGSHTADGVTTFYEESVIGVTTDVNGNLIIRKEDGVPYTYTPPVSTANSFNANEASIQAIGSHSAGGVLTTYYEHVSQYEIVGDSLRLTNEAGQVTTVCLPDCIDCPDTPSPDVDASDFLAKWDNSTSINLINAENDIQNWGVGTIITYPSDVCTYDAVIPEGQAGYVFVVNNTSVGPNPVVVADGNEEAWAIEFYSILETLNLPYTFQITDIGTEWQVSVTGSLDPAVSFFFDSINATQIDFTVSCENIVSSVKSDCSVSVDYLPQAHNVNRLIRIDNNLVLFENGAIIDVIEQDTSSCCTDVSIATNGSGSEIFTIDNGAGDIITGCSKIAVLDEDGQTAVADCDLTLAPTLHVGGTHPGSGNNVPLGTIGVSGSASSQSAMTGVTTNHDQVIEACVNCSNSATVGWVGGGANLNMTGGFRGGIMTGNNITGQNPGGVMSGFNGNYSGNQSIFGGNGNNHTGANYSLLAGLNNVGVTIVSSFYAGQSNDISSLFSSFFSGIDNTANNFGTSVGVSNGSTWSQVSSGFVMGLNQAGNDIGSSYVNGNANSYTALNQVITTGGQSDINDANLSMLMSNGDDIDNANLLLSATINSVIQDINKGLIVGQGGTFTGPSTNVYSLGDGVVSTRDSTVFIFGDGNGFDGYEDSAIIGGANTVMTQAGGDNASKIFLNGDVIIQNGTTAEPLTSSDFGREGQLGFWNNRIYYHNGVEWVRTPVMTTF